MTYLIALAFVAILAALLFAGIAMVRRPSQGQPKSSTMMRALALRITLSVLLFLCIWGAYHLGWIQPTGLPIRAG